jgi:hypothetical protein
VALLLPFMRCGELLLGAPQLPLTPVSIKDVFWHHQGEVLRALGHAMLGWAVCFPFMAVGLTFILQPIFGCLQRRYTRVFFFLFPCYLLSAWEALEHMVHILHRLQKRAAVGVNGIDNRSRLLDEDAGSVCSADERQARRSGSTSPGPPVRDRGGRWQHVDGDDASV